MIAEVQKLVASATGKARRIIRRGLIKAAGASGFVQVSAASDDNDEMELWQQAGFTSRPAANSEALVAIVDGNEDQPIAFATTNRAARPTDLEIGDAAMYGQISGSDQAAVKTRADGSVELSCATGEFVEVGGDASLMLLGETVKADVAKFATSLAAATTVAHVATAGGILLTDTADWLATKGKVA